MRESGFFRRHGSFVLFAFLVLSAGLYVACTGSLEEEDSSSTEDAGKRDDAPTSNH